jgi:hypothetical protein
MLLLLCRARSRPAAEALGIAMCGHEADMVPQIFANSSRERHFLARAL